MQRIISTRSVVFLSVVSGSSFLFCSIASAQSNPFVGNYSGTCKYIAVNENNEKQTGSNSFALSVDTQGHVKGTCGPKNIEFDIDDSGGSVISGRAFGTQSSGTGTAHVQFLIHNNRKVVSGTFTGKSTHEDEHDGFYSVRFNGLGPASNTAVPPQKPNVFSGNYSGKFKAVSAEGTTLSGDVSLVVDSLGNVTVTGVPFQFSFTLTKRGSARFAYSCTDFDKWGRDLVKGTAQVQFKLGKNGAATFSGQGAAIYTRDGNESLTFSGSGTTTGTTSSSQRIARYNK